MSKVATWKTKDGRVLKVADMEDSHLINTIKYMQRRAEHIQWKDVLQMSRFADTLNGEMAVDCAEQSIVELGDMHPEDYLETLPDYQALVKEATRRKLTFPREIDNR